MLGDFRVCHHLMVVPLIMDRNSQAPTFPMGRPEAYPRSSLPGHAHPTVRTQRRTTSEKRRTFMITTGSAAWHTSAATPSPASDYAYS